MMKNTCLIGWNDVAPMELILASPPSFYYDFAPTELEFKFTKEKSQ